MEASTKDRNFFLRQLIGNLLEVDSSNARKTGAETRSIGQGVEGESSAGHARRLASKWSNEIALTVLV